MFIVKIIEAAAGSTAVKIPRLAKKAAVEGFGTNGAVVDMSGITSVATERGVGATAIVVDNFFQLVKINLLKAKDKTATCMLRWSALWLLSSFPVRNGAQWRAN